MLSCSIVCYKTSRSTLQKALASILNANLPLKVYLVDNSPSDITGAWFKDERIEYIYNGANIGFGPAHNLAMRKSLNASKYHLILNPDIYFYPGTIENIYEFMEKNTDIGLLMPKVLYPDGSIQYLCKLLPTPADLLLRKLVPFKALLRKRNYNFELRFSGYDKIMDVPFLSGCFMFLRADVLKMVGLFDERIFMYVEDVDLCRRIHRISRVVFYPGVSVFHEYASGSPKSHLLRFYGIASSIKYFNKWGWFLDRERTSINRMTLRSLL